MADNYLEKRMADYREGRLAGAAKRRPATTSVLPPVHIHHSDPAPLVKALRALGAAVSFSGVPQPQGAALAQSTGSTYVPLPLDDAVKLMTGRRGRLPVLVTVHSDGVLEVAGRHLFPTDLPASEAAPLVIALAGVAEPLNVVRRYRR